MKVELDNFIIESDKQLDYFDEIVYHVKSNENKILSFFNIDKLPNKVNIKIVSYEPFKEFIISKYGEILEYVCGDSDASTHTIRILNIDDQIKYTNHKNASVDQIKSTALHEIVHQCHHVFNNDFREIIWFAEGLATNISEQEYQLCKLDECDFDRLKKDFRHCMHNYNYAYTIFNYILNNYSMEEITRLYSDSNYLRSRADIIFDEAKIWVNDNISAIIRK